MPILPPLSAASDGSEAGAAHRAGTRRRCEVGLLTAAIALLLDQQTKHLAVNLLQPPGRTVEGFGPLDLQLTFNPGGAFGQDLPGGTVTFLVITVVVVLVVAANLPRAPSEGQAAAYGLLLAGALGNAADRVLRAGSEVVDFLKLPNWPIFNVADVAITSGFFLLVVLLYLHDRRDREREGEQARGTEAEQAAARP